MTEKEQVTRAAGIVGISTLLSRIFGFVRDIIIAAFFGAGLHSDAFIAAFRIPNLLRRLFAEGTLTIAFIPIFTRHIHQEGKKEAFDLARSAMFMLFVILSVIVILGIIFSPMIVEAIAFGFKDRIEQFELTVLLTRIMFPYALLISLVALFMGILNTLGHFAAPALAPVLLNIAMILAVMIVSYFSADTTVRIIGLSCGVLAGGILQLVLQVPYLLKEGFSFFQKSILVHPGLKQVGRLMLPAVLGAGVYQINMLIGTFLASLLPTGSISYLYYADRLVQFPLGIFAIAIATAVLPSLSRHASAGDMNGLKSTFAYSFKLILYIMLPSIAGLIALRDPMISLLLERGKFDQYAVLMTSDALLYYSSGIWATAAVSIVVRVFYALGDSRAPVTAAVISILANIFVSVILMVPMQHSGLALATSIASTINLAILVYMLRKKLGSLGWRSIIFSTAKSVIISLIMGMVVWLAAVHAIPPGKGGRMILLIRLFGCIGIGLTSFVGLSMVLKMEELKDVFAILRRKKISA
ncbi:MAG: murein biosynthesis integral membrane protein MurJ [Desulfobacteraceae bacterium]|nr:MAG: murein biosynthesis integral membrane protein MurJ [Desulfobacteraceae bacterium]